MAASHPPMPRAYQPQEVEGKWYRFWLEGGYFTPQIDPRKKPFVIIMPPPNVTGELHLGHALTAALEDSLVRWHRMRGEPALWLPGEDHAGIASQNVVEQLLAAQGLTRHQLGRERFLERMWEWAQKYRRIIAQQHQRLGASCDWSRERFTLDEGPSRAVRTTFVRLYHKGLIYRGERIIHWCPRCATALSDLEVEHEDVSGHLYYLRYPLQDGDGFITVATTRPETLLGDTAVAVNPQDQRFRTLVGRRAVLPILGRVIPIIADEAVDPRFGTGAVKVTPAHDPVDFEIAQRQGLALVNILNAAATLNEEAGPYRGLDRFEGRRRILADLEREGFLEKVEPHVHSVGHCQRCRTVVEPWVSQQWFVRMAPLAQPALQAVLEGRIQIVPQRFVKVYQNWMENIRDWCVSRQLWWGHRIPVWYCQDCGQVTVPKRERPEEDPRACSHCASPRIDQDPDVLDTWFSSALWPHSTLGWPGQTRDLAYFYPTSVMETGYDILFFWVARMILMGLENTGEVPFRTVYLHGLIRDEKGEKMSKSRGNVVDPLQALESYGTDALRFALSTGSTPGNDMRLSPQRLEASRNFANKLWNAARFVLSSLPETMDLDPRRLPPSPRPTEDRWILSRLHRLVASVNSLLEDFQIGEAQRQVHDFLWGEYCDWYIEMAKLRLRRPEAPSPLPVLAHVLETALRLLHPFMPFITEELWQGLRRHFPVLKEESLIIAPYPEAQEGALDPQAEGEMEDVIEVVRAIRNVRAEARVEPARFVSATIQAGLAQEALEGHAAAISTLARAQPLSILGEGPGPSRDDAVVLVLRGMEVILPRADLLNPEAEKRRLEKEMGVAEAEMRRLEAKLGDEAFLSRAPAAVVERERGRLEESRAKVARLRARRAELG